MVIERNLLFFFFPSWSLKNKGQGRVVGPATRTTRGGWRVEGWKELGARKGGDGQRPFLPDSPLHVLTST